MTDSDKFDLDEYVQGLEDEDEQGKPEGATLDEVEPDVLEEEDDGKIGNYCPDWGRYNDISTIWSEVEPGLWVGGTADEDTVGTARLAKHTWNGGFVVLDDAEIGPEQFDAVVTFYAWARPVDWGVEEYRWHIFDGGQDLDKEQVRDAVAWAHKRWKAGKKVLLRCQAGLSRSTFHTVLVLVRDGWDVEDAIKHVRSKRSRYALTVNGSAAGGPFTRILNETPVEFWRE